MRVNHRFLYWGIFLVALGGVLVTADLTSPDANTITGALRFWPLALIAIGLGLVLRRSRFALAGGLLAAAVPGLVLGGAFALAPHVTLSCASNDTDVATTTRTGSFDGSARVDVQTGCGTLVVDTATGSGWRFDASDSSIRPATVDASATTLTIDAGGGSRWHPFDRSHDAWHLTLPSSPIGDLTLSVNAGSANVDLTDAAVARLTAELNAGAESIRLSGASDLVGRFDVNAGSIRICAPPDLGVIVRHDGALGSIRINGREQGGQTWQSPDYAAATHHADLTITTNLGSAEINPIGGCK